MFDASVNLSVLNMDEILNSNLTILLNNTLDDLSTSLLIYDQTAYMVQELVNELKTNFSTIFYNFNNTVFEAQDFLISLNDPIQIYTNLGNEALFNLRIVFPLLVVSISLFIIQSLFLCYVWCRWNWSNGKKIINILK